MIDTHAHLYAEEFNIDRNVVVQRALDAGVQKIILPNVDSDSLQNMLTLEATFPDHCHACIGVHPTSINLEYQKELDMVQTELDRRKYIAVGEIGIDLYWETKYFHCQELAFRTQLDWALAYQLPVIIHVRDSFRQTMNILADYQGKELRGVFHSFTGNKEQLKSVIQLGGFYIGINGIITFKNASLHKSIETADLDYIVLETDAPYLSPSPFRGKRNESAYLPFIAKKLADATQVSVSEVVSITNRNAQKLFTL